MVMLKNPIVRPARKTAAQKPTARTLAPRKPAPRKRMTEEEFVAWCDEDTKAEWINGEVIVSSPSNLTHVNLAGWLNIVMRLFAEHFDCGFRLRWKEHVLHSTV